MILVTEKNYWLMINVYIWMYIMENGPRMWRKILKNKVIQSEKSNMKENRHYNVSVL